MSIEAIALASKLQGVRPRDKFVLIALANFANDDLRAWPKQSTLAEWTCMTRETVNRALTDLEEQGLILSEQQRRDDGGYRAKRYDLSPLAAAARPPVTDGHTPLLESVTPPVTDGHSKNHHKNHQEGTDKPLSAFADESASESNPSPKKKLSPAAAEKARFDSQMLQLMAKYNANRESHKGSLVEARGRSKARDAAARAFLKDMKRNGYDPLKCLEVVTRYLAFDDYYLGKGDGPRRGFETVLRNWSKYYEEALNAYKPLDLPVHTTMRLYLGNRRTAAMVLGDGSTPGRVKVIEMQRDSADQRFKPTGEPIEVDRSWLRPGEVLE